MFRQKLISKISSKLPLKNGEKMHHPQEYFGKYIFSDAAQKAYLSKTVYEKLKKTMHDRSPLDNKIADDVAQGMINWALEKGVTHYTHRLNR